MTHAPSAAPSVVAPDGLSPAEPLRLLLVEDSPDDAALIVRALERGGYAPRAERVETAEALVEALYREPWDVVIADYALPQFDGLAALRLLHARGSDLPFILVSGAIGEETAVEAMRAGAHDYVMKTDLRRLAPAVRREVREACERERGARVEQALSHEREFSHQLIEESTALIIGVDADDRIIVFNAAAERLTGYRRAVVHGQNWLDVAVAPCDRLSVRERLAMLAERRRAPIEIEHAIVTSAGDERIVAWRSSALTRGGADIGTLLFGVDVTDRRRAEAEAARVAAEQAAREEAEAENRAKDVFLAMLAHELRTPQTALRGYALLLRRPQLAEAVRTRALEAIERTIRIQEHLIGDLLDMSRIAVGKLVLKRERTNVAAVIEAAVEMLLPGAVAKGVEIAVEMEPGVPSIVADPTRLQQVVWNLVSNAVKFTPSGGRVSVRSSRQGRDVVVHVSDSGIGIDSALLPQVFDHFRQAQDGDHGGLGLGLAIVRHIVERHGGSVAAESAGEGKGAVFTVVLPLDDRSAE